MISRLTSDRNSYHNEATTDLPTQKYFCQYSNPSVFIFSYFWPIFFSADAPPINQKCKRTFFSIIHLVRTVYELTFSNYTPHYKTTMLYKTGSLWHLDTFISLYLLKSFWIEDRRTLSPKAMHTMWAGFADADASFLKPFLSGQSLFPWFLAFLLLFVGFVHPFITDSFVFKPTVFKPTISEDG